MKTLLSVIALLLCNAVGAEQLSLRIMPLGDSITQGYTDSYRSELWALLRESGWNVDFVGSMNRAYGSEVGDHDRDHEGHWGWRADEVLERIEEWAKQAKPDVVLVHLGTNDIGSGETVAQTMDEIEQIINQLRMVNPRVHVLLAEIIPVDHPAMVERIQQYNLGLVELAGRLDSATSRILPVDQFNGFDAAQDTYDGIHPNSRGNRKMADRWLAALETLRADTGSDW